MIRNAQGSSGVVNEASPRPLRAHAMVTPTTTARKPPGSDSGHLMRDA